MNDTAASLGHYTVDRYYALAECGILAADDRVELLDGLIVAMPPPSPRHDFALELVQSVLQRRLGLDVRTRVQSSFVAGSDSVPQPDLMVLPGRLDAFDHALPTRALLVVEVALSSLPQDRLTKSIIYARAGVPCYWIVNLRDFRVEVYRDPDRFKSEYRSVTRATGTDILTINEFPGVTFEAAEFLPPSERRG